MLKLFAFMFWESNKNFYDKITYIIIFKFVYSYPLLFIIPRKKIKYIINVFGWSKNCYFWNYTTLLTISERGIGRFIHIINRSWKSWKHKSSIKPETALDFSWQTLDTRNISNLLYHYNTLS